MSNRCFAIAFLLSLSSVVALAQETPKSDPRLPRLLERFPDADADRDGVLTEREARQYRQQRNAQQNGQRNRAADRPEPTHADVAYGPAKRNVLDLYLATADSPTPLVIYIHGGGFVGGDKRTVSPRVPASACRSRISTST